MEKFGIVNTEKEEIKLNKKSDKHVEVEQQDDEYYKEDKHKIKIISKPVKKIKDKSKDKSL